MPRAPLPRRPRPSVSIASRSLTRGCAPSPNNCRRSRAPARRRKRRRRARRHAQHRRSARRRAGARRCDHGQGAGRRLRAADRAAPRRPGEHAVHDQGHDRTAQGSLRRPECEVSTTSQSLSQAATEQAAGAEETSASIEQMTASIAQNNDSAKITDTMATKAAGEAAEGGAAVKNTVTAMKQIAQKSSRPAVSSSRSGRVNSSTPSFPPSRKHPISSRRFRLFPRNNRRASHRSTTR